jgi:hypothetical protein
MPLRSSRPKLSGRRHRSLKRSSLVGQRHKCTPTDVVVVATTKISRPTLHTLRLVHGPPQIWTMALLGRIFYCIWAQSGPFRTSHRCIPVLDHPLPLQDFSSYHSLLSPNVASHHTPSSTTRPLSRTWKFSKISLPPRSPFFVNVAARVYCLQDHSTSSPLFPFHTTHL